MRNRLALVAALAIAAIIATPITATPAVAAEPGTVTVQLALPDGYTPPEGLDEPDLEGVEMYLSEGTISYLATTDANGVATFAGMQASAYTLHIGAPQRSDLLAGYLNNGVIDPNAWAAELLLTSDGASLTAQYTRGALVRGQVLDPEGAPVAGARVDGGLTDDEGRFVISRPPGESGLFVAAPAGSGLINGHWQGNDLLATSDYELAQRIVVAGDLTVTPASVTVRLVHGATVTGTITNPDGTGAADVQVQLFGGTDTTDADGRYSVGGIEPGQHTVRVTPSDPYASGGYITSSGGVSQNYADARQIVVTGSEAINGVDAQLTLGGAIEGAVTGLPASISGSVSASPLSGGQSVSAPLRDGRYTLGGLTDGEWSVNVYAYGPGSANLVFPSHVVSVRGGETTVLDIEAEVGGSISGRVLDRDGNGLPSIYVTVSNADGSFARSTGSSFDGRFVVGGLAAGTYRLDAQSVGGTISRTDIVVTAGAETALGDLHPAVGDSSLEVIASDENGAPLAGASVWVRAQNSSAALSVVTDADGRATVTDLPAGEYTYTVLKDGYDSTHENITLGAGQAASVAVTLTSTVFFELSVTSNGAPIEPHRRILFLEPASGHSWEAFTDVNGVARAQLRGGEYTAQLLTDDGQGSWGRWSVNPTSELFTVGADQTSHAVELDARFRIDAQVNAPDGAPLADAEVLIEVIEPLTDNLTLRADDDGSTRIDGLSAGTYRLSADIGGTRVYLGGTTDAEAAELVTLTGDSPRAAVTIEPGGDGYALISGTVTAHGWPVASEQVRVRTLDDAGNLLSEVSVSTDQDGNYTAWLPAGGTRFDALAAHNDWSSYAPSLKRGDLDDEQRGTADFELDEGVTITGTLLSGTPDDPLGGEETQPVVDGSVSIEGDGYTRQATTAADGSYTVTRVDADNLTGGWASGGRYEFPVRIEGVDGERTVLELGAIVRGTVTVDGGDDTYAAIHLWGTKGEWHNFGGPTNSEYDSGLMHAGDYRVMAHAPGWATGWFDGAVREEDAEIVTVRAGEDTTGIDFRLGKTSQLSGQLTAGGIPLAYADVVAAANLGDTGLGNTSIATTDRDGNFTLTDLDPGDVRVVAYWQGTQIAEQAVSLDLASHETVDLEADTAQVRSVVRFDVSGADGVHAGQISAYAGPWWWMSTTYTLQDGFAQFVNLPVESTGRARFELTGDARYLRGSILADGSVSPGDQWQTVRSGETYAEISVSAERPARLFGVIRNPDGAPVPGAAIHLDGGFMTYADDDGHYDISVDRLGDVILGANDMQGLYARTSVAVDDLLDGESREVDVTLQGVGAAEITVTDVNGQAVEASVSLWAADNTNHSGITDPETGVAHIPSLPPGDYTVYISGFGPGDIGSYLGGGSSPTEDSVIRVEEGQTATAGHTLLRYTQVDIDVTAPGIGEFEYLRVDLLDPETGELVQSGGEQHPTWGPFSFYTLERGSYLVRVEGAYTTTTYLTDEGQTTDIAEADPIVVSGDGEPITRSLVAGREWANSSVTIVEAPETLPWGHSDTIVADVVVDLANAADDLDVWLEVDGDRESYPQVFTVAGGGGRAYLSLPHLPVGTHEIALVVDDTAAVLGSRDSFTLEVEKTNPTVTVDAPAAVYGDPAVITVDASHPAVAEFHGTADVTVGGITRTVDIVHGRATAEFSDLPVGDHDVSVTLPETERFVEATASATLTVTGVPTTIAATNSGAAYGIGMTAEIAYDLSALGRPITGSVEVRRGSEVLASADAAATGTVQFELDVPTPGDHAFELHYLGDGPLEASSSSFTIIAVGIDTTVAGAALVPGRTYGEEVKVFVSVSAGIGTPTGRALVTIAGITGQSALDENGQATVLVSGVPVGIWPITIAYPGDGRYSAAANRTGPLPASISPATATVAASAPADGTFGSATGLPVAVSTDTGVTAGGAVRLLVDGTEVDAQTLSRGSAHLTIPATTAVGQRSLEVVYDGDANIVGDTHTLSWRQRTGPPALTATVSDSVLPVTPGATASVDLDVIATGDGVTPITYRVWWGDGSAVVAGVIDGPLTLSHAYAAPGRYFVRVEAQTSDDRTDYITSHVERVVVYADEPLVAVAGDSERAVTGDTVWFDASASRPAVAIDSVNWDFGDGTTATGWQVAHAYDEPGDYTATLTVGIGDQRATATRVITVAPISESGAVDVTVRSAGGVLSGAQVTYTAPDGARTTANTDGSGVATLRGVPDGRATLAVWANGFQPATLDVTVTGGAGRAETTLTSGEIASTVLDHKRLTVEEIIEAGIDVEDPQNTHVYEANVQLHFVPVEGEEEREPAVIDVIYVDGERPRVVSSGCTGFCNGDDGGGGGGMLPANPTIEVVDGHPIIQWLVVPARASWLKEMFEVTLVVANLAPREFTFTDGLAQLNLPAGLTLPSTSATAQSLTKDMADIPGGSSGTTSWFVRGDVEGSYDLTAQYSGVVSPVDVPLSLTAQTATPLKVWGAAALETTINVEPTADRWSPYRVEFTAKNVTTGSEATPVYNLRLGLHNRPPGAPDDWADYIFAPGQPEDLVVPALAPGDSESITYTVYPGLGSPDVQHMLLDLSYSSIVQTGGTVSLAPRLQGDLVAPARQTLTTAVMPDDEFIDKTRLSWSAVDGAAGYRAYSRSSLVDSGEGEWRQLGDDLPASTTTADFPANTPELGRYVTVVALTEAGEAPVYPVRAAASTFAALGDSFSAGEGVPDFVAGTDTDRQPADEEDYLANLLDGEEDENVCHRSIAGSYAEILSVERELDLGDVVNVTCSGAIAADVTSPNPEQHNPAGAADEYREPAQIDAVNDFTEVITLTMGGNDAGFGTLGTACVIHDVACDTVLAYAPIAGESQKWIEEVFNVELVVAQGAADAAKAGYKGYKCVRGGAVLKPFNCTAALKAAKSLVEGPNNPRIPSVGHIRSGELTERLVDMYDSLLDKASQASIYVGTYPRFFDDGGKDRSCFVSVIGAGIGYTQRLALNDFVDDMNVSIAAAVNQVNAKHGGLDRVQLVDVNAEGYFEEKLCIDGERNGNAALHPVINPYVSWPEAYDAVAFSFHPNAAGQREYADAFRDAIQDTRQDTTVRVDHVTETTIEVPAGSSDVRVKLRDTEPRFSVELIAPGKMVYDGADGTSTLTRENDYVTLEVPAPAPGMWTVRISPDPSGFERGAVAAEPRASYTHLTVETPRIAAVVPTARGTVSVEGSAYTFDASASTNAATYLWTFPDGATASGATATRSFEPDVPAQASLAVTSIDGTRTTTDVSFDRSPRSPLRTQLTPEVSGEASVGGELAATASGWFPVADSVRYQWLRDGEPIDGATAATYQPVRADLTAVLTVRATASAAGYVDGVSESAPIEVIADRTPTATAIVRGTDPALRGDDAVVPVEVIGVDVAEGDEVTVTAGSVTRTATIADSDLIDGGARIDVPLPTTGEGALLVGRHTLTAGYAGNLHAVGSTSAPAVLDVLEPTTVTGSSTPVAAGTAATIAVTVEADEPVEGFALSGSVTATAPGWTEPVVAEVTAGAASLALPVVPLGTHDVVLTYPGSGPYAPATGVATVTVRAATTASALTVTPATSTYGDALTAKATVTTETGTDAQGTLAVFRADAGGAALGDALATIAIVDGQGEMVLPRQDAAAHRYVGVFAPADATLSASTTGLATAEVAALDPAVVVTFGKTTVASGEALAGTVSVTALGAAVDGTVTASLGDADVDATSTGTGWAVNLPTAGVAAGAHEVTVRFASADDNIADRSVIVPVTIVKAGAGLVASLDRTVIAVDDAAPTLSVSVPRAPSDSVTVARAGDTSTVALDAAGAGTLVVPALGVGTHEFTVRFAGNATTEPQETIVVLIVQRLGGTVSGAAVSARHAIDPIVVTARFAGLRDGAAAPTGVVIATDAEGDELTRATLQGGTADLTLPRLAVGAHTVTLGYAGDDRYAASEADTTVTVAAAPADIDVVWPAAQTFGDVSGRVEVEVGYDGTAADGRDLPVATGRVQLVVDGQVAASADLTAGAADLALPETLSAGDRVLAVRYLGADGLAAGERTTTLTVAKAQAQVAVTGAGDAAYGDQVTWNVAVETTTGARGTGTVTVTGPDGARVLTLIDGAAAMTVDTRLLGAGSHRFDVSYAGDAGIDAGTMDLTLDVTAAASTVTAEVRATTVADGIAEIAVKVSAASALPVPAGARLTATSETGPALEALLGADGRATILVPSALADGHHRYTVAYPGGFGIAGSTAEPVDLRVSRVDGEVEGVSVTPSKTEVAADGTIEIVVEGLSEGDGIHAFVHSSPVYLGSAVATSLGRAVVSGVLPATLTPGAHRLEVRTPYGIVSAWIVVGPPATPGGGADGGSGPSVGTGVDPVPNAGVVRGGSVRLPATGTAADPWPVAGMGAAALLLGALLVLLVRRRFRDAR